MQIKKRDGRLVKFQLAKVEDAIVKALSAAEEEADISALFSSLEAQFEKKNEWDVEEVQDIVENVLMEAGLFKTAKAYIKYRQKRSEIREGKSALMDTIHSYFKEDFNEDSSNKENANVNAKAVSGTFYRIGSEASKVYYGLRTLPEDIKESFDKGYIYFHDRDYYGLSLNCMQHDLLKMFQKGFSTGNTFITDPQSISSAMALTCVILQSGQTDLFGGESIPAWDFYMEPYVEKSFKKFFSKHMERLQVASPAMQNKYLKEYTYQEHSPVFENDSLYKAYSWAKQDTEAEAYQAAQAMVHNLNSLACRSGQH